MKRDSCGAIKAEPQFMEGRITDPFDRLHEPLIINILSTMDLKDAAKTSLLAKSWRTRWTEVTNIFLPPREDYDVHYYVADSDDDSEEPTIAERMAISERNEMQWISSINQALGQCTAAKISKFFLFGDAEEESVTHSWIEYALDRNVEIMELTYCNVPNRLYQSSSIITLEICNVMDVYSPLPVTLSSLKSLILDNVSIDDAFFEKLLMGCPVLESVVLEFVDGLHHVNIMSPKVKKLILSWFEIDGDIDLLIIKAPWLEELTLSGKFATQCQLVEVSSLRKADLTIHARIPSVGLEIDILEYNNQVAQFNDKWISMVGKLLMSLSYVAELTIGSGPIQVMSMSIFFGMPPSPVFKCKHLSLETYLWEFDIPGIVCLLENAPHLETLFITVLDDWQVKDPLYQVEMADQDRKPQLRVPSGKFLNLKNVKIDYRRCSCHDSTDHVHGKFFDFGLVKYILKKAVALDTLVLCSSGSGNSFRRCPVPDCSFQFIPRLSGKLLTTFQSGNEAAEWKLKKSQNKYEITFNNASLHPTSPSPSSSAP